MSYGARSSTQHTRYDFCAVWAAFLADARRICREKERRSRRKLDVLLPEGPTREPTFHGDLVRRERCGLTSLLFVAKLANPETVC